MMFQFCALLVVHWFADFVLQTDWQAKNKSDDVEALLRHVGVYTGVFTFCSILMFGWIGIFYGMLNGTLHMVTDYNTSKWTKELYQKGDTHNFFVIVGLDQLIHQLTIAFTLWLGVMK